MSRDSASWHATPPDRMARDPFTGVQIRVGVMGSAGGELGTVLYEEGKLIGVLEGTGGITDALPALEASLNKQIGSEVLYDSTRSALVRRLLQRYASVDYLCSCHPAAALERRSAKRRDQKASGSARSRHSLRGRDL